MSGIVASWELSPDNFAVGRCGVSVLERVRALLAQAESTGYPAEAEAFTDKAHELMTRHAIDAALVHGTAVPAGWATAVRIAIDDPYVDTKSLLLQVVGEHSRCRTVFHSRYAMSTVVGGSRDVAATQLLFTSLLLQGQQALLADAAGVRAGGRERTRGYRTSFLFAYANRIGERLAECPRRRGATSNPPPAGRCCQCWRPGPSRSTGPSTNCSVSSPSPA